jgi:hypothetical protein
MVPAAPRYDVRLVRALRLLDDPKQPIAETCRRLGQVASRLGLPRPSYVHVRRLVHAERARRRAVRALVDALIERMVFVRVGGAARRRLDAARLPRWAFYAPLRR